MNGREYCKYCIHFKRHREMTDYGYSHRPWCELHQCPCRRVKDCPDRELKNKA